MILLQYKFMNMILFASCYILVHSTVTKAYNQNASPKRTYYREGDPVKLTVNKLTSKETLLPVDYDMLPFCRSPYAFNLESQNLGQFLLGERVRSSPYEINFKKDKHCETLCMTNLGRGQTSGVLPNKIVRGIEKQYSHNWKLDDKPILTRFPIYNTKQSTLPVLKGFPVGFSTTSLPRLSYINNHVKIEIYYHRVQNQKDSFTIDGSSITPYSIQHVVHGEITNFDISCDPNTDERKKTLDDVKRFLEPQLASGKVIFTYDVVWIENTQSSLDNHIMHIDFPSQVYWYPNFNSFMVVIALSIFLITLHKRNFRQGLDGYQKLESLDDKTDFLERFSWKLVHADVFRPPPYPMVMSVVCGTGIQTFLAIISSLVLLQFGFLDQAYGGTCLMAFLLMYALMGVVSGYVSANLYKTFQGKDWTQNALATALSLPSISFGTFGVVQCIGVINGSSLVVPPTVISSLLMICCFIETPLVLMGSYLGQKHKVVHFPVKVGNVPSQVSDQPWFIRVKLHIVSGGAVSFASMTVPFFILMMKVWRELDAVNIGALLIAFILLVMTVCTSAPIMCMAMFGFQNYNWWWHSFFHGASTSIFILLYSINFSRKFGSPLVSTYMLYYSYMCLVCLMVGVMLGAIAVLSSLYWNLKLFGSINCSDEESTISTQIYHDHGEE